MERVRDMLVKEREVMADALATIPFLQPFPSQANFILCRVKGREEGKGEGEGGRGWDAREVRDWLRDRHGVMVRHYAKKELSGFIRVSVGTPEQTRILIEALRAMV